MTNSSKPLIKGKPTVPPKPYAAYPLFAHQSGRWAKKVKQKIRFYGRWGRVVGGKMTPLEDQDKAAADALAEFNRCWPFHSQSKDAPAVGSEAGVTLLELVNKFIETKKERMENGELSVHSYEGYYRLCRLLLDHFGKTQRIDVLSPDDFQGLRNAMAKGCSLVTLRNRVNITRVLFKYAYEARAIDRPVHFGQSFERPPAKRLRAEKNSLGPKMFTREEILRMLDALEGKPVAVEGEAKPVRITPFPAVRAMVLLGVNAGFGNTDVASLKKSAVNLKSGWITFPRPKTEVDRRIPLWPETIEALKLAIANRPDAEDVEEDGDLVFLTKYGSRLPERSDQTQPKYCYPRRTEGWKCHQSTTTGRLRRGR